MITMSQKPTCASPHSLCSDQGVTDVGLSTLGSEHTNLTFDALWPCNDWKIRRVSPCRNIGAATCDFGAQKTVTEQQLKMAGAHCNTIFAHCTIAVCIKIASHAQTLCNQRNTLFPPGTSLDLLLLPFCLWCPVRQHRLDSNISLRRNHDPK